MEGYPLRCSVCKLQFTSIEKLEDHVNAHPRNYPYQCSICSASFSTTTTLTHHIGTHDVKKVFQCMLCLTAFHDVSLLTEHVRSYHKDIPYLYNCASCNQAFDDLYLLKTHVKGSHNLSEEKVFECSICSQTFDEGNYLWNHIALSHKGDGGGLKSNFQTEAGWKDVHSGPVNQSVSGSLSENNEISYLDVVPKIEQDSEDGYIENVIVDDYVPISKSENDGGDLGAVHSTPTKKVISTLPFVDSSDPQITCKKCSEIFSKDLGPTSHFENCHLGGLYSVHCVVCWNQFGSLALLKNHHKLTGCEGLKCKHCAQSFSLESELARHLAKDHQANSTVYQCDTCQYFLPSLSSLYQHVEKHVQLKVFVCKFCHTDFINVFALYQHLKNVHFNRIDVSHSKQKGSIGKYDCDECGKSFGTFTALKSHEKTHMTQYYYLLCGICGSKFDSESLLKDHQISSDCKGFKCDLCSYLCTTEADLLSHKVKSHSAKGKKKGPYHCSHCPVTYDQCHKMIRHIRHHETNKHLLCKLCDGSFSVLKVLLAHLRDMHSVGKKGKHGFLCSSCGEHFQSRRLLNYHKKRNHASSEVLVVSQTCSDDEEKPSPEEISTPHISSTSEELTKIQDHPNPIFEISSSSKETKVLYICNLCPADFSSNKALKLHLDIDHKLGSKNKWFQCDLCGSRCSLESTMRKHLTEHMQGRIINCPHCPKRYHNKHQLKAHVTRVHCSEKPFKCHLCDHAFKIKGELTKHIKKHHNSKSFLDPKVPKARNFVCVVCGMTFFKKGTLQEHAATHTNIKRFVCEICGKAFGRKQCLKLHARSHTGEKPFICSVCGKRFVKSGTLKDHIRKKHPEYSE